MWNWSEYFCGRFLLKYVYDLCRGFKEMNVSSQHDQEFYLCYISSKVNSAMKYANRQMDRRYVPLIY
jgi:hypothetical protein